MNLSTSGWPSTPPAALIFLISSWAAVSAGASNGDMPLVRSIAAPITIGDPAACLLWAALVTPVAPSTSSAPAAIATESTLANLIRSPWVVVVVRSGRAAAYSSTSRISPLGRSSADPGANPGDGGRPQELPGDDRARAGAEPRARPGAGADVPEPVDGGAMARQ